MQLRLIWSFIKESFEDLHSFQSNKSTKTINVPTNILDLILGFAPSSLDPVIPSRPEFAGFCRLPFCIGDQTRIFSICIILCECFKKHISVHSWYIDISHHYHGITYVWYNWLLSNTISDDSSVCVLFHIYHISVHSWSINISHHYGNIRVV